MEKLIKNIKDYLEYLAESTPLHVSIHFSNEGLRFLSSKMLDVIMPYNYHKNRYCNAVKRTQKYYERCLFNQQEVISVLKEQDVLDRTCFAGVREISFPIKRSGEVIGFVTASGYAGKKEGSMLSELWESSLIKNDIPFNIIHSLLPPLCSMMELYVSGRESQEPSEMSRIKKYIADTLPNVTLGGISKHLGRSSSYISHIFKKNTGRSIRAYCNELKLFEAQKLLSATDLSVTEVAFEAGFEDTAYFIRLFRETYGITPNKYKKG